MNIWKINIFAFALLISLDLGVLEYQLGGADCRAPASMSSIIQFCRANLGKILSRMRPKSESQLSVERWANRLLQLEGEYKIIKDFNGGIATDGNIYGEGPRLYIYIPGTTKRVEITLYPPPVIQDGKALIAFRRSTAPTGYQGRVLESVSVEEIWQANRGEFEGHFSTAKSHFLVPDELLKEGEGNSLANAFTPVTIDSIDKSRSIAVVNTPSGRSREVPVYDLFAHNFFISKDEIDLVNGFFRNGGKGRVVLIRSHLEASFHSQGYHILVDEFPEFTEEVFYSRDAYLEMIKLKGKYPKIPILLSNVSDKSKGACSRKVGDATELLGEQGYIPTPITSGTIFFSRHSTVGTVWHEFQHWDDDIKGLWEVWENGLRKINSRAQLNMSEKDMDHITTFIAEYRAYAHQMIKAKNIVDRDEFDEELRVSLVILKNDYGQEVLNIIESNENGPQAGKEILRFIKENIDVHELLNFEEIFGNPTFLIP